jgi:hypothetical protein
MVTQAEALLIRTLEDLRAHSQSADAYEVLGAPRSSVNFSSTETA